MLEAFLPLLVVMAALLLDRLLGEPRHWHPLVGFGALTTRIETALHGDRRWRGVLAWALLVVPPVLLIGWAVHAIDAHGPGRAWLEVPLLYLAIGHRSLGQHAAAVQDALRADKLPAAREAAGRMVSRDLADADAGKISSATIESVLENGNDAVFGAIFWFLLAGAPGALLYRLANTLDAMWGYRTPRFRRFGWAAARIDDILNWAPARLTVLGYALAGRTRAALRCAWRQGRGWKSPNAGPVMAAGAGALGLTLGGAARYHGRVEARPVLGEGRPPVAGDIAGACGLLQRALLVWILVVALVALAQVRHG